MEWNVIPGSMQVFIPFKSSQVSAFDENRMIDAGIHTVGIKKRDKLIKLN